MSVQSSRRISHDHFTRPSQDNPTFQKQPASKQKAHQAYQTDIMGTYALIAVAKQHIAKKIDQRSDKGHYMMAKQVSHEYTPATSHLSLNFAASFPQIYSPTSAPLYPKMPSKPSRVPAIAQSFAPTQQFVAVLDASVDSTLDTSQLTPTNQFEKMLNDHLEAKTKAKMKRKAEWYRWW